MGVMISTVIGIIGLIVVGVMSSMAASKSGDCKDAKKYEIWTAIGAFLGAIVMLFISIFFL